MRADFYRLLRSWWFLLGIVVVASLPTWLSPYYLGIANLTALYIGLALAWNIAGGIAGQLSLGHSLFRALGALLPAVLLGFGVNMWLGMVAGMVAAALLGALITWLTHRFNLNYLSYALVTFALAQMGYLVVMGWDFIGGASGMNLPPDTGDAWQMQLGGSRGYFWALAGAALVCYLANAAILNCRHGYYMRACRTNPAAAQAVGVPVLRTNVIAMSISAALTAMVATFYARSVTFIDPAFLPATPLSIEIVLIATIGGLGTLGGPALAALILVPLGEVLRARLGDTLPGLHYFLYGVLVILVMLLAPDGVVPALQRWWRARIRPPAAAASIKDTNLKGREPCQ